MTSSLASIAGGGVFTQNNCLFGEKLVPDYSPRPQKKATGVA
jgi:hypothetical protein